MLLWIDFISRKINFILREIENKSLSFSLEQRKEASRAILSYYISLEKLEEHSQAFLKAIQPVVRDEKSRIYSYWLRDIDRELQKNELLYKQSFKRLINVLGWINPNLQLVFSKLFWFQRQNYIRHAQPHSEFLDLMQFKVVQPDVKLEHFEFTMPSEALDEFEFEAFGEFVFQKVLKNIGEFFSVKVGKDLSLILQRENGYYDGLKSTLNANYFSYKMEPTDIVTIKKIDANLTAAIGPFSISKSHLCGWIKETFEVDDFLGLET